MTKNKEKEKDNLDVPKLGGFLLALVDKRLLNVIGWVELGLLIGSSISYSGPSLVLRENAAIFGLDSPETTLVVHLGSRKLSNAAYKIWVSARSKGFRGHFVEAALCSLRRYRGSARRVA